MKSTNMSSTTGRSPAAAAPTAAPTNADSEIGVSQHPAGPNLWYSPLVTPSTPPQASSSPGAPGPAGDVLAHDDDGLVALHLLGQRLVDRLAVA